LGCRRDLSLQSGTLPEGHDPQIGIIEMPSPAAEEPGTVKEEDHHHRQNPQPIDIVSSFLQDTSSFKMAKG